MSRVEVESSGREEVIKGENKKDRLGLEKVNLGAAVRDLLERIGPMVGCATVNRAFLCRAPAS